MCQSSQTTMQNKPGLPNSPGGGATTASTGVECLSPNMHRRRHSFGSKGSQNQYNSVGSAVSFASEVYENIDLDETEQSMKEVDVLTEHIKYYN